MNTKAEVRLDTQGCTWILAEVRQALPSKLIMKSDQFRTQPENQSVCLNQLFRAIKDAANKVAPSPTSTEQVQLVERLKKAANEQRLDYKRHRSNLKSDRQSKHKFI